MWWGVGPSEGPGAGSVESGGGARKGYSAGRHGGFCWTDMELIDLVDDGSC